MKDKKEFASMDEALRTFMDEFGGGAGGSFFDGKMVGGHYGPIQGASKKTVITVSFEEAVKGTTKEIVLNNLASCTTCHGKGAKLDKDFQTCPQCQGKGEVLQTRGFFSMSSPCDPCRGTGKKRINLCSGCAGEGIVNSKQHIKVPIPAGIDDGMRLKLSGYGDVGKNGGPAGDLYVFIEVKPHPMFRREADHLIMDLSISSIEALSGTKKEFTSIFGKEIKIKIPKGTLSGKVFRIRNKGIPHLEKNGRGDLLVNVIVGSSQNFTSKKKNFFKDIKEPKSELVLLDRKGVNKIIGDFKMSKSKPIFVNRKAFNKKEIKAKMRHFFFRFKFTK